MSTGSRFLFSHENSLKRDLTGSELFQTWGLTLFKSAPTSFLLVDTDTNSSGEEESETFFSDLMNGTHERNPLKYSMGAIKQEIDISMEPSTQNNGSYSVRQTTSPAGFFSGFGVMGEVGSYRMNNRAETNSSTNGLSNHMNFSSGPSSTSPFMPSIPENGNQNIGTHGPENGNGDSGREHDSWNDSPFNNSKRNRNGDMKMICDFNGLENENRQSRNSAPSLTHHLSLPKISSEMAAVEKFLQFQQDTVPCQIRAKRGCATHPRSIAERMRRTRISQRMKKLQELCPNMDKQTNTADMLDLAVEYIKDLQKQVQTLTNTREKCSCPSNPKQASRTT